MQNRLCNGCQYWRLVCVADIDIIIYPVLKSFKGISAPVLRYTKGKVYPNGENENLPGLRVYILRNNCAHLRQLCVLVRHPANQEHGPVISAAIVYPYIETEHFTEQIVKSAENCTQIRENFASDFSNIFRGRGGSKMRHLKFWTGVSKYLT